MTAEKVRDFLEFVKNSGLHWDDLERAQTLADRPEEFLVLLEKTMSPVVVDMLLGRSLKMCPTYLFSKDMWLEKMARWTLTRGGV